MTEQFWLYDRRPLYLKERNLIHEKNLYNMTKAWKYIARGKDGCKTTQNRDEINHNVHKSEVLPTAMDNPAFSPGDKNSPEFHRATSPLLLHEERLSPSIKRLSPLLFDKNNSPRSSRQRHSIVQSKYEDKQPRDLLRESLRQSRDSLRSSTTSIPEVIEECSSDDENFEEDNKNIDYMNCINCSLSKSTTSIDSTTSDPFVKQGMNSCYRCRHLSEKNTKLSIPNIYLDRFHRPLSWSAGDRSVNSPRLRRGGLSMSNDLPSITESCDESEAQDLTDKTLQHFQSNASSLRRRTTGDDIDIKNIKRLSKKFKTVRKNCDFL